MLVIDQKPKFSEPVFAGLKQLNTIEGKEPAKQVQAIDKAENGLWDKAQSIAEWVCSRESTYRSALDLVGWELPSLLAASTRNIYSFAEAVFMSVIGFVPIVTAPSITKFFGSVLSKFYLDKEDHDQASKYLLFQLNDLDDAKTVKAGIERMKHEEPEDCSFMMDLNKNKEEKVQFYANKSKELTKFFKDLKVDDTKRKKIKALKKAVIQAESFVESFIWGGYYFFNRMFRKYVLKQDRFTGTKAYESDEEAKKNSDSSELSMFQKFGILGSMLSGPLVNKFLLDKVEDTEAVAKSPWLKTIKSQWDMTHGVFPKLGLLFSYVQIPATFGQMFAAQGKNELTENIMRQFTMVPSWWFGHQLTNGVLAKNADKKLSEKFSKNGILVEPQDLHKIAPDPAKIQHILKATKANPELEKEARKEHAKALYKGFGLHAMLVFGARMLMNWFTKFRVTRGILKS